ncbi:uncharacterized protein LOC141913022 [Tubulanus polymorphus]|uniref:uncharacterized protein LOC141913022 n=1 Tax=Tubulanus polymorphus TaxID=672921 RepID=UPI003DA27C38
MFRRYLLFFLVALFISQYSTLLYLLSTCRVYWNKKLPRDIRISKYSAEMEKVTLLSRTPSRYVAYRQGDSQLILTAPHGGYNRADDIRRRVRKGCRNGSFCYNDKADSCTIEMTLAIAHYLKVDHDIRATVVLMLLHRSRLDANRYEDQDRYEDEQKAAETVFDEYTDIIKSAISRTSGKNGLILDIHGHLRNNWVQMGYAVPSRLLNRGKIDSNHTSIRNLYRTYRRKTGRGFKSLLSGDKSLGHYLQQENTRVDLIPSPKYPTQESDDNNPKRTYTLTGGYTSKVYGRDHPTFNAIQLEFPKSVRDQPNGCQDVNDYRRKVAAAISAFYRYHFE